jgi:histone H3/H4
MKYNIQAVEFREEMLRNLSKRFTEQAEEIATKDKRNVVSKEDMARAALQSV